MEIGTKTAVVLRGDLVSITAPENGDVSAPLSGQ